MRKLALTLVVAAVASLASCSTTWKGSGSGLSADQHDRDIKDVRGLSDSYETQAFWADQRRRMDGRRNAFGRDLRDIGVTIDRHFFNYSENDPYVNFETETGYLDHILRFTVSTVAR